MIVVANASPICYLLLIGHVELLEKLFGQVVIPPAVRDELSDEGAPALLRTWMAQPPTWLQIQPMTTVPDASHWIGCTLVNARLLRWRSSCKQI